MKIGILGAGNVGQALGGAYAKSGHEIIFGVSDPGSDKHKALAAKIGAKLHVVSNADCARESDVMFVATPWKNTQVALAACGPLNGKIVVDCTNPLKSDLSGLEVGPNESGAEQVAHWTSGAKVVKTFNQTGAENMAQASRFAGIRPVMFVCGDDSSAKEVVSKLVDEIGFEAIDAGALPAARLLEQLAMLWIHLAFKSGLGRNFAFALTKAGE